MREEESTLLIVVGPVAVGKMTVGQEVGRITGWPLFYNHLLIDLVTRFFPFQSPSFQRLTRTFTVPFFEEIAATRQSLIVTYGWAFDEPELVDVLLAYIRPVTEAGHRVCFAELEAPLDVRLKRNLTENRRQNKNTDWATEDELRRLDAEHRWNSEGAFPLDMPHLVVDTTTRTPNKSAEAIVKHFGFPPGGKVTSVQRWHCPRCGRGFGREGQGHTCAPGMTVDEYFGRRPPYEREIFEAVMLALQGAGPVHIEAVNVGVFFKRGRSFAQLRHKTRWVRLGLLLPRRVEHPLLVAGRQHEGSRNFHYINLRSAEEVTDEVAGWLAESYIASEP